MRSVSAELITAEEAREAIRNSAVSDATINDLIRGAREAAEEYLNIFIAESPEDEAGWSPEELPRTIKIAMYYWMACTNEMMPAAEWLPSFKNQLAPWRDPPCA